MKNVNQTIVETFREVAEYLETGWTCPTSARWRGRA